ncbi:Putative alpha-1,2-mannosidase, six-hairpin glycosidase superfamily [Septoria linicola]|uniref:Alpha-1,2-mannosidase, six-hairpin glycosidase superfamily n=1 Tax=Septoria linicola TaxID=215465 RepID=A0A9Q9AQI4_9PEZI|nr:putative alpha-1,2-mannosidase, six-hairpin glycosidase superfamily [Septoria linicola]USW50226.1 Putative alpha-1,2-mannosidase, six-hairpin glycosidase superfamily [Septoria linicola]
MFVLLSLVLAGPALAQHNYSQYVNPFIGGEGQFPGQAFGGGDIFVGGAVPFGVAKVGIDTYETNLSYSTINGGWTPKGIVTGISMMHESGTGGAPKYGIISQMPLTSLDGEVNILDNTTSQFRIPHLGIVQWKRAVFSWSSGAARTVKSRIGISFISAEKACARKNEQITTWNLDDTVAAAVEEWNRDVFSKVQVPVDAGQNQTDLILLYSHLYFTHLMPSDRSGENPLSDAEDAWDDFYTAWDIFRCTTSLYHLIQPEYYQSMIRALIDIWKYEGYMPDGRSGNYNGLVQGGSDADNILADAYVKNLPNINWTEGYQAMVKNAEVAPYNAFSYVDQSAGIQQGRGALKDWLELGYVSSDRSTRTVSRTIEYALNDYSLSQVAKGIAPEDVEKYLNRSANWQAIWSHNLTHKSFTGFLAPRLSNGEFNLTDYNPAQCGSCSWNSITYEGTPFEYGSTVPHDVETLINFMGGPDEFERRLDYIFLPNTSEQDLGANGAGINTLMNIGNEPDFATPYEYNYINKQAKSVEKSRSLGNQYFKNALYGVPGNSDAGALNSWMVWQMLGIYPVVTQTVYLLSSPWFSDINVTVNGNHTLRITASNLDNANSYYVQSVKVNGRDWDRNWFEHDDVMMEGGSIEFEMGTEQRYWETGDVPPSPGHYTRAKP